MLVNPLFYKQLKSIQINKTMNNWDKKVFKDLSIILIRRIAAMKTKRLTKHEKELLNYELHELYTTLLRETKDIYQRYNRN